jgi:hypothetical protein
MRLMTIIYSIKCIKSMISKHFSCESRVCDKNELKIFRINFSIYYINFLIFQRKKREKFHKFHVIKAKESMLHEPSLRRNLLNCYILFWIFFYEEFSTTNLSKSWSLDKNCKIFSVTQTFICYNYEFNDLFLRNLSENLIYCYILR